MKPHFLGAVLLACSSLAGHAALFTFDSNETVNVSQGTPLSVGVTIGFGVQTEIYDEEFNLVGERWEIDPAPIDPITEAPATTGYGSSTTDYALNGLMQPTLILFSASFNIDTFSIFLDESTWGYPGAAEIFFLGEDDSVITTIDTFQDVPNYEATGSGIQGVKAIVLPSGAMYDNLTITGSAVPEPASFLLGGLGLLGLLRRRRA